MNDSDKEKRIAPTMSIHGTFIYPENYKELCEEIIADEASKVKISSFEEIEALKANISQRISEEIQPRIEWDVEFKK